MTTRLGLLAALVLSPALAYPQVGQIKTLSGEVSVVRDGVGRAAALGDRLQEGDAIVTGGSGRVGITFVDNSRLSAGPNSTIELARFRFDATTHDGEFVTGVKRGTLAVVSGQVAKRSPDAMKVTTPSSILGMRGTHVLVRVPE